SSRSRQGRRGGRQSIRRGRSGTIAEQVAPTRGCSCPHPRLSTGQCNSKTGIFMQTAEMTAKIANGNGFIAALDQSGGSTPKALKGYGVEEGAWSNDEEMFGLIHQMRSRIFSSPAFTGDKVIGAILFERTMDGQVGGKP